MGRTSASFKASGGDERRASRQAGRPSNPSNGWKRPSGANADGAPTLRNVIPWQDMERKLAERLAAKAGVPHELSGDLVRDAVDVPPNVDTAPDSGVRSSEDNNPARPLTYSVYTVADLEARSQAYPQRTSMVAVPSPDVHPARWLETGNAAIALLRVCWTHVRAPKPRPRLSDVAQVPFQLFLTELRISLRSVPWRKLALGSGIALGTLLVLLFIVLTAAELTDDLKPARTSTTSAMQTARSTTSALDVVEARTAAKSNTGVTTTGGEPKVVAPPPARAVALEPAHTSEIEDADPPPPPGAKAKSSKPAAKKRGATKKAAEIFIP